MRQKSSSAPQKIIHWDWLLFTVSVAVAILFFALAANPGVGGGVATLNLKPFIRQAPAVACVVQRCSNFQNMFWLVIINVVGNIVVFVPFGYGLTAAFQRFNANRFFPPAMIALGFLFSLGIELTQLSIPSRITDIDDIILNTLGTIIGLALWYVQALFGARKDKNS